jgi:hypothetical protein
MFRSGTTLFARMVHTHDDVVCASDPFRPFFNALRDNVARNLGHDIESFSHLSSYFADEKCIELFDAVQAATLEGTVTDEVREELHSRIIAHAEPFSPKITSRLDGIRGETFRDIYDSLWEHVPAAYGHGQESWEATKEVWMTEFTPTLARAYPDSKFVHIVRDPRAVCASKNVQQETKYPWLFLIRQWRKLAILSDRYSEMFPDRLQVVRYEDLVQSPRQTVEGLCAFLDISFDERLLDPSNFVDGNGEQWLQNTSYEGSSASFDTTSVNKWRDILTPREVEFIEQLTFPEMSMYGYEPDATEYGLSRRLQIDPPRVPTVEIDDWIAAHYADWDHFDYLAAVGTERIRQGILKVERERLTAFDDVLLKGLFLDVEHAHNAWRAIHR